MRVKRLLASELTVFRFYFREFLCCGSAAGIAEDINAHEKPHEGLLAEIVKLISANEGVTILGEESSSKWITIEFAIESHKSHLLLVYCGEASNVPLRCWSVDKPNSDAASVNPALALRYQYSINLESRGAEQALDDFCWLGAFLTWTMHSTGVITKDDEKRLAKVFKAGSRS